MYCSLANTGRADTICSTVSSNCLQSMHLLSVYYFHYYYYYYYYYYYCARFQHLLNINRVTIMSVISGFLLYVRFSLFWPATWRRLTVNRRFGTNYRPHLQGSRDCLTLKDGNNGLARNVGNCKSMLRNIPEDGRFQTITVRMAKRGNESYILKLLCVALSTTIDCYILISSISTRNRSSSELLHWRI